MPIRPPDKVVTHRIELGRREREMIESVIASYSFNRVATPVVAGMSDVSFMVVLGSILTAFYPNIVIPTGVEQADEILNAIITGIKESGFDGFGGLEYGLGPLDTPRSLAKLLIELLGGDAPNE
jgi:hypothetical protein